MNIKNKRFYKIVSVIISIVAVISVIPFSSFASNNEVYHSSVFENRDIKVSLSSSYVKITFPKNTSKYLIKINAKGIANVNAGKTVKISSRDLPEGKYNIMFLISNGIYDSYTQCGFFGPLSVADGKISYQKSEVLNQNVELISKLSAATESERREMLKSTESMQSDDPSIINKTEELVKGLNTDLEKIEAIYKFLVNNIYYDYDYLNGLKSRPADDAVSVLKTKTAVCDGYASLMVAMLRHLKIPVLKAAGYAESPFNAKYNLRNGETDHAWVVAYINGKWLSFDPTFDCANGVSFGIRDGKERVSQMWEYFGIDIRQLSSYRRFDGYISEIVPSNTRIVADKNNFKIGMNESTVVKFNIEPVWASGNGSWILQSTVLRGYAELKLHTLGNAALLDIKGTRYGRVSLDISAKNVPYSFNFTFTVYNKNTPIQNRPSVKNVEMHRLYNPNSGEHFYTKNISERNNLISLGWRYEGIGWTAPKESKTPVYRLYNPNAGDHHYTMDFSEKEMLVSVGWNYEGVGWYSDDLKRKPLYRQYNPNAKTGTHNYTLNKSENDKLIKLGWNYEGVSWYGV